MLVVSFSGSGRDILILESIWFDKNLSSTSWVITIFGLFSWTEKLYVLYMHYIYIYIYI